jgi:hypothetical protein
MKFKLIRLVIVVASCSFTTLLSAQEKLPDNDVYRAEIGITGGGSYYLGDANSRLFYNLQPTYGSFFRYVLNPRIAFRVELNSAQIAGNFTYLNTTIPLNNTIYSADICGEFNFFDLENNPYKRLSKTFSPYIFAGIGGMTDLYIGQKLPEISIPFGIGMKLKLGNRWNLNLQWSNKLLLSDYMEGNSSLNNPQSLNGSNIFNNDLLSTLTIGISFDIWKKECHCLNSNAKK